MRTFDRIFQKLIKRRVKIYVITRDPKEHNEGMASRFTRVRTPVKLVYEQEVTSRSKALKREAEIKKLSRGDKLDLILAAV